MPRGGSEAGPAAGPPSDLLVASDRGTTPQERSLADPSGDLAPSGLGSSDGALAETPHGVDAVTARLERLGPELSGRLGPQAQLDGLPGTVDAQSSVELTDGDPDVVAREHDVPGLRRMHQHLGVGPRRGCVKTGRQPLGGPREEL